MKTFSKKAIINFICVVSISCVMTVNSQTVKADGSMNKTTDPSNKASKVPFLQLSVKPDAEETGAIVCQITLMNPTDKTWYFFAGNLLTHYNFMVKDKFGKLLPLTLFGKDSFPFGLNNRLIIIDNSFIVSVEPGKSHSYEFPVNRLCDMTKPGEYTVSVSREVIKPDQYKPGGGITGAGIIDGGSIGAGSIVGQVKPITITSNTVHIKIKSSIVNNIAIVPTKTVSQSNDNAIPPSDQWQVGDQWKLNADIFAPDAPLSPKESEKDYLNLEQKIADGQVHILSSFTMIVKVADIKKVDNKEQVKLVFTPDNKTIYFVRGRTPEIIIDRATHQLLEMQVPGHPNNYTSTFNGQQVIVHSVDGYSAGFPVDIIPQIAPANFAQLSEKYGDMHLNVSRNTTGDKQTIQEILSVKGKDWFRVTQIWSTGSKWWSEYLKEDFDAQIGMRAKIVGKSEIKWGSIIHGIQLGISSDDTLTRGGDAVHLHIALRNTLDQAVAVPSLFLGQSVQVKMINKDEAPVSLTELGKMMRATSRALFAAKTIPPHSVLSGDVSIDKIFDLSRAGAYSISATTGNSLQDVKPLKSSPLIIQVENNDFSESFGR